MKQSLVGMFIVYAVFCQDLLSQIPNGGFEEWEPILNFENPIDWSTNQDTHSLKIEKDTISIESNYSLKFYPPPFETWSCSSSAWTGVNLQSPIGSNQQLVFYAKSIPENPSQTTSVFLSVSGRFYESGNFDSDYNWTIFEQVEEFTKFTIPIKNPNIDSLTIRIKGGTYLGPVDGCKNRSFSWIDAFSIEDMNNPSSAFGTNKLDDEIVLFPNPTNGVLEITPNHIQFDRYYLLDLYGRLIESNELNSSTITLKSNLKGIFILKLIQEKNGKLLEVSKKILVE